MSFFIFVETQKKSAPRESIELNVAAKIFQCVDNKKFLYLVAQWKSLQIARTDV